MYLLFFLGAIAYGAVTLVFLILSSSELVDSGVSTPSRLFGVLVTSVFWPATLVAVGLALGFQNASGRLHRPRQTVPLHLSHRSH